jgi:CHRD domain
MLRTAMWALTGAGLLLVSSPALAAVSLLTLLSGANETWPGDPEGTGRFSAEVDADTGDLCYTLVAEKIAKPVAAHVHEGAAGTDGKPVITLQVTGSDGDVCLAAEPDLLKLILATPQGYYVNVHTGDFPAGAIRGQLSVKP